MAALVLLAVLVACGGGGDGDDGDGGAAGDGGNVVVILTDDQTLSSLGAMANVQQLLAAEGTTFSTTISTFPLCCPARASLLTGQLAHNHGVQNNVPPDGGYQAFDPSETLPVWLQRAGYATAHVGKYLNGYGEHSAPVVPPGWDRWFGLVDPSTYRYWGFTAFDGTTTQTFPADASGYSTTVLAQQAVADIEAMSADDRPFYLEVATLAPHLAQAESGRAPQLTDLTAAFDDLLPYAPGTEATVAGAAAPVAPSVGEADLTDKPEWVRRIGEITGAAVASLGLGDQVASLRDEYWRRYLSAVVGVDTLVADVVHALERTGELDDTLIVFTSDNGLLLGEHNVYLGKVSAYEESLRVPLVVRGAGFDAASTVEAPVANVDLPATILDWVGDVEPALPQDGRPLPGTSGDADAGRVVPVAGPPGGAAGMPPYVGVRTQRYAYVAYDTGEAELYDLQDDPFQLANVVADPRYAAVVARLAEATSTLATCAGADCVTSIPPEELVPSP